jgi:aryl-alcohol dehydrogenase-like predicted oxidoreductase
MTNAEIITKRRLGGTDLEVTPIGLGVMQFAGNKGMFRWVFPNIAQEEMNAIVKTAVDGGINWFDTAEMYGRGWSEQALAMGLKTAGITDEEVVIGTKWFPVLRTARNIPRTIQDRLRFLGGYTIDLYMIHQPVSFSSIEAQMDAMADLVEAGKIRYVGISNFNADQMRQAHSALQKRGLPLTANQVEYSLMHRKIETNGTLETARELGVTIVAYSPLGRGILTGKYHQDPTLLNEKAIGWRMMLKRRVESSRPLVAALQAIAPRYDATPAQVALNWLIHAQGEIVVAIPGASKVSHAAQSAGAMSFRLSDEEMQELDGLSRGFK